MHIIANYSVMVNEDITIGTEVIRITASDADSGIRGRISYGFYGFEVTSNVCVCVLVIGLFFGDRMKHLLSMLNLVQLPW